MRHSFWNVFHGSHGSPPLLVFKHWSVWSCVNRAPPQSGSPISPLHLNVDGTILIAGCGSSAGQRGSTTRSNNGQAASMTWDWVEKNDFIQGKKKYQGEALKRKERYGWGLISKSGSYEGRWICESGSPAKLHGIAIAVTAQDGSNVYFFASWCSSRKKLGDALKSIFMVEGKLQIVSRELNGDLLFFEETWQRERPPL